MNINNKLANERIGLLIVKLSFPAMAGMAIYSLFALIDTFFIAKLGSRAMAAMTLCIPVEILLLSLGSATGVGLTSLISRTLGQGDSDRADNIAWHGIIISIVYGLLFSWLGIQTLDVLLHLFGATPETFVLSKQYLHIIFLGSIFIFIPIIAGSIIQGEGNTFVTMLTALAGIIANVIFDPIFIFGLGPVKAMGLTGAAIATFLSQMLSTAVVIFLIFTKRSLLSWSIKKFKPDITVLIEIYKVGIPTLVIELSGVIVMALLNKVLISYSYTAVAALGIFLRIRSLFYTPISGLAQGTMPIAGFAYGAGNNDRVKETIIKASLIALLILSFAWYMMQYQAVWIMSYFSTDPALSLMGIRCMRLATIFLPFMGPIIILSTVLQSIGKGVTAMWFSIIRQLLFFLPAIIILPRYLSINGVWLAFSLAEFLSAVVALVFLIYLWRELQQNSRYKILFSFKTGNFLKRIFFWMKW